MSRQVALDARHSQTLNRNKVVPRGTEYCRSGCTGYRKLGVTGAIVNQPSVPPPRPRVHLEVTEQQH